MVQENLLSTQIISCTSNQGQSFLREDSFSPGYTLFSVRGMAQGEEWSKHFFGFIHFVQGALYLVQEEWPRVRNGSGSKIRNSISSLFMKNRADIPLLMRADILLYLTNVSERLAQRIHFIFNNIFLCRMASDDCYGDYLSPNNRDILLWWICSTILRQIFFQSSQM